MRLRALVLVACVHGTASAEPTRTAYVARVLAAVHDLGAGAATLERDLYAAARTTCRAGAEAPPIACLVGAATARCRGDATCEAAADVIVTNLRAANDWVDEATRARLVRESADYHAALAAELQHRFAALAAELVLAGASGTRPGAARAGSITGASAWEPTAAAIDRLCAERDRTVHACRPGDTTCVPSLPWSRCVAALAWFVGGAP